MNKPVLWFLIGNKISNSYIYDFTFNNCCSGSIRNCCINKTDLNQKFTHKCYMYFVQKMFFHERRLVLVDESNVF
jgi:hypothetical protein